MSSKAVETVSIFPANQVTSCMITGKKKTMKVVKAAKGLMHLF